METNRLGLLAPRRPGSLRGQAHATIITLVLLGLCSGVLGILLG